MPADLDIDWNADDLSEVCDFQSHIHDQGGDWASVLLRMAAEIPRVHGHRGNADLREPNWVVRVRGESCDLCDPVHLFYVGYDGPVRAFNRGFRTR